MKLDKTLNFKKVRCVKGYDDCLEIGKEYNVIDISVDIKVKDDRGEFLYWESDYFEPVIDELSKSAENPLQDMKLTPEFETEASEPKFEVGNKVYFGFSKNIEEIERFLDSWGGIYAKSKSGNFCPLKTCCHATQENYELLSRLYPHIKFDQPPKPLTGSDLARAMLDRGWQYIPCYVSNYGESEAQKPCIVRKFSSNGQFVSEFEFYNNAVPFDPRTGAPLTAEQVGL